MDKFPNSYSPYNTPAIALPALKLKTKFTIAMHFVPDKQPAWYQPAPVIIRIL
jgi:hypothetical protein